MASIHGLSKEQCAALEDVQPDDLIFVQKRLLETTYDDDYPDHGTVDDENQNDDDFEDAENEDENDGRDDNEVEIGIEDGMASSSAPDDNNQDDDENGSRKDDSDDTEATEVSVPPKMYVVSIVAKDATGTITDVQVSRLKYSSTVGSDDSHTYQIYRNDCIHNHSTTCGQGGAPCSSAVSIAQILKDEELEILVKPDGDLVKFTDQDLQSAGRCITGCWNGYLASHEVLRNLVKDYNPPTLSVEGQDLTKIMPPICPVCFGIDVLKQQQTLQGNMLLGAPPDLTQVIDFIGSLDTRRRQLNYRFRQFDEREWNILFDDMLSDEEDDGGRWEHWAEAMDPNNTIQTRPASNATVASLTRKTAKEVELGEDPRCMICKEEVQEDHVLIELPCGHIDQHEECATQWLKYSAICPTCRECVPAITEDEEGALQSGAGEQSTEQKQDSSCVEEDVEDTIMCNT